jgi:hypothetical protein
MPSVGRRKTLAGPEPRRLENRGMLLPALDRCGRTARLSPSRAVERKTEFPYALILPPYCMLLWILEMLTDNRVQGTVSLEFFQCFVESLDIQRTGGVLFRDDEMQAEFSQRFFKYFESVVP